MMANHGIPVDPHSSHVRKSNKPLLEKKRRARINRSLDQLKSLVLEALKKDTARYSKLEKADILEMTVRHLREVQRQEMTVAMSLDPTVSNKYRSGFAECAQEVNRYLGTIDGLSPEVRMRLMQHLTSCGGSFSHMIAQLQMSGHVFPFAAPVATPIGMLPGQAGMYPEEAAFTGLPGAEVFCRNSIEHHGMTPDEIPSQQNSPVENMTFTYERKDNLTWSNGQSNKPLGENNGRTVKRESAESMDAKKYYKTNSDSVNHRVSNPGQPIDVKSEPVWRPW